MVWKLSILLNALLYMASLKNVAIRLYWNKIQKLPSELMTYNFTKKLLRNIARAVVWTLAGNRKNILNESTQQKKVNWYPILAVFLSFLLALWKLTSYSYQF